MTTIFLDDLYQTAQQLANELLRTLTFPIGTSEGQRSDIAYSVTEQIFQYLALDHTHQTRAQSTLRTLADTYLWPNILTSDEMVVAIDGKVQGLHIEALAERLIGPCDRNYTQAQQYTRQIRNMLQAECDFLTDGIEPPQQSLMNGNTNADTHNKMVLMGAAQKVVASAQEQVLKTWVEKHIKRLIQHSMAATLSVADFKHVSHKTLDDTSITIQTPSICSDDVLVWRGQVDPAKKKYKK